jgi:hypothetical protein
MLWLLKVNTFHSSYNCEKKPHEVRTFDKKVQLSALQTNYINSSNMILTNQDKEKNRQNSTTISQP